MVLFSPAKDFHSLYQAVSNKAESIRLQAKGGSMYPFIRSGDWIKVEPIRDKSVPLKKGAIVLFRKNSSLYLHRIIGFQGRDFISKGDMSFGVDGAISRGDILGRALSVESRGRVIDLTSPNHIFMGRLMADASRLLQYPVWTARTLSDFGLVFLSRIQNLKIYRLFAKRILRPELQVLNAAPEDAEDLRDLYLMEGVDIAEGLKSIKDEGLWLIAKMRGRTVGGVTVSRFKGDASLWLIFGLEVKTQFRGIGAGELLVKTAVDKAQKSGAREIGLIVRKSGAAAGLYHKLGFSNAHPTPPGYFVSKDEDYLGKEFFASGKSVLWDRLTAEEAQRENLFYPFYRRLVESGRGGILKDERRRIKEHYYVHLMESAKYSAAAERILTRLDRLGREILVFKGPAVDSLIYDGYCRPRLDLDLAVNEADIPFVKKALTEIGYEKTDTEGFIPANTNDILFTGRGDALSVDIHSHLINDNLLMYDRHVKVGMEKVWKETERFGQYRNICILRPEMNLMYLCAHGLKHDFEQLVFVYEIGRLIESYGDRVNWNKFLALTREFEMERIVYYGLYFVNEFSFASVPAWVPRALKPTRFTWGERSFIKNTITRKISRYSSFWVYLASRGRLKNKITFLFRTAFPPQYAMGANFKRAVRIVRTVGSS